MPNILFLAHTSLISEFACTSDCTVVVVVVLFAIKREVTRVNVTPTRCEPPGIAQSSLEQVTYVKRLARGGERRR